ncbi:TPA: terminase small subunit [Escherichia coli]|nr:terminase small subunit [Escherichia coli]
MNVNKKKLADIFGVDVRTITAWQSQGLRIMRGSQRWSFHCSFVATGCRRTQTPK